MDQERLDQLVERVRVASFEAPKAHSHSEWKRRIEEILLDAHAASHDEVATEVTLDGRVREIKIPMRDSRIS